MHYLAYAIIPVSTGIDHLVAQLLAPFEEGPEGLPQRECGGDENNPYGGIWDWYQIGGRWTGYLNNDYDPEKDPQNIETCNLCNGTGQREDEIGKDIRSKDPSYTCNGCSGKGVKTKWPTQWKHHVGDIIPLDSLERDDEKTPHTLFFGRQAIDKAWSYTDPEFPRWGTEDENEDEKKIRREKIDKIETRIRKAHSEAVWSKIDDFRSKDYMLVVIDYHS